MAKTRVTGERVSTCVGGFNPTWQRHAAAYLLCAPFLPDGRILDAGCGVGHSHEALAPRTTIGLDLDPTALREQDRETRVGDMRALPFPNHDFDGVISVQAIEHVPDPERVVAEARRVLRPGGVAVFVTPNRLTFGPPEEIVDPYHHVEFSGDELRLLCTAEFRRVEMHGLFGSDRYHELIAVERRALERTLRLDPLRLRRLAPRRLRQHLYDWGLRRHRRAPDPRAAAIVPSDFFLGDECLDDSLDLIAVCLDG